MSFSTLFAGFAFGVIGFYLLKEGRKRVNGVTMGIGLVLMIYPYFIDNAWLLWGAGFALCGLAYKTW